MFLEPDLLTGMRLESFHPVRKTSLDSDWLKNHKGELRCNVISKLEFKSLAVTPSGPGLLDESRFDLLSDFLSDLLFDFFCPIFMTNFLFDLLSDYLTDLLFYFFSYLLSDFLSDFLSHLSDFMSALLSNFFLFDV